MHMPLSKLGSIWKDV